MSEALAEIIRAEIRAAGPVPVSRWMELCLYHPQYGYYMKPGRKTGAGPDADFVTPPTLHPFFGRAVGLEIRGMQEARGGPALWRTLEYGGGEGDLAHAAMDVMNGPGRLGFAWRHKERSRAHQTALAARGLVEAEDDVADVGVFCEVLDAVACDAWDADGDPVAVDVDGARFRWTGEPVRFDGGAAASWLAQCARRLRHVLIVDYGATRSPTTVRAFKGHAAADPLANPGDQDLTVDVDFAVTQEMMGRAGFREVSLESLESFLLRHGILEEINAIDRSTREGASSYLRLRQLLLPTGLGAAFKVQRFDRVAAVDTSP